MRIEIEGSGSDQHGVWIGLLEVSALPDCEIEGLEDMAGAFVSVLAWADDDDDYIEQVEAACRDSKIDVHDISDIELFSEGDFSSADEDDPSFLETSKIVEETHEVAFHIFYMYKTGETKWDILEQAITDIGYWNWWAEKFPDAVRVEFSGVQLWCEEPQEDQTPRGVVTLEFSQPTSFCFLTRNKAVDDLPQNWPDLMHGDQLEDLPNIRDNGELHFNDRELNDREFIERVLDSAQRIEVRFGLHPKTDEFFEAPVQLAFWAGDIGCVVGAQEMTLINQSGEVSLDDVEELHQKWWKYWEEYWEVRGTDKAFPEDYACEATIPGSPPESEDEA